MYIASSYFSCKLKNILNDDTVTMFNLPLACSSS